MRRGEICESANHGPAIVSSTSGDSARNSLIFPSSHSDPQLSADSGPVLPCKARAREAHGEVANVEGVSAWLHHSLVEDCDESGVGSAAIWGVPNRVCAPGRRVSMTSAAVFVLSVMTDREAQQKMEGVRMDAQRSCALAFVHRPQKQDFRSETRGFGSRSSVPTAYHSPIRARAHAGASCIALETMQARPPLCALHVTNNIRQCRWVVQESPGEHFIVCTSPDLLALPDECQHANHTWGEMNRESLQVGWDSSKLAIAGLGLTTHRHCRMP
jgi:hypothetical protein